MEKAPTTRFQPEEDSSRGLLCNCKIFVNLRITSVSSSACYSAVHALAELALAVRLGRVLRVAGQLGVARTLRGEGA